MPEQIVIAPAPAASRQLTTLIARCLRLSLRTSTACMTALVLPVMLMLMFVYFFGGAIDVGTKYIDYVVPGVLLVCVGFGAGTTAVSASPRIWRAGSPTACARWTSAANR